MKKLSLVGGLFVFLAVIATNAEQKKDVIDFVDPALHVADMHVVYNQAPEPQQKAIRMNLDGNDIVLNFNYIKKNDQAIVLPLADHKPGAGYELFSFPGHTEELLEFNGSIYVFDVENGKIEKILSDHVGNYSLKEAKEKSQQKVAEGDPFVWWGSRPSVNPGATKMVFYTNRSGDSEIWVKDLIDGDERLLLKSALTVKGWANNNEFIADSFSEALRVNAASGEVFSYGKMDSFEVSYPYLIAQRETGSIQFINLDTNEKKIYTAKELGRVVQISAQDGSSLVGIVNQPDRTKPLYSLLVLDSESLSAKTVEIPPDEIPLALRWQDSNTLLLTVQDQSTNQSFLKIIQMIGKKSRKRLQQPDL